MLALSLLFILPNLGYDFLDEDRKVKYTIQMHFLNKTYKQILYIICTFYLRNKRLKPLDNIYISILILCP